MSRAGDQSVATGGRILEVHYALRPSGRTRAARSRQLPTSPHHAVGGSPPVTRVYQGDAPSISQLHSGTRPAHARSPTTAHAPQNPDRKDRKNRKQHLTGPSISVHHSPSPKTEAGVPAMGPYSRLQIRRSKRRSRGHNFHGRSDRCTSKGSSACCRHHAHPRGTWRS